MLHITERLREVGVVDWFVEFFGPGVENLTVPDRATIANMSPEQGSTIGMFPVDEQTLEYLELTGRDPDHIDLVCEYLEAQGLFGEQEPEYTEVVEFGLLTVRVYLADVSDPPQTDAAVHWAARFVAPLMGLVGFVLAGRRIRVTST